jgi:hypothetical protein
MATMTLSIGSATAEEARAFVLAFQTSSLAFELPRQVTREPTVKIMGIGWHVTTPLMSREHAAAMSAMSAAMAIEEQPPES